LLGMKRTLITGDALTDYLAVLVNQNTHRSICPGGLCG
jgi:hypothetical protein